MMQPQDSDFSYSEEFQRAILTEIDAIFKKKQCQFKDKVDFFDKFKTSIKELLKTVAATLNEISAMFVNFQFEYEAKFNTDLPQNLKLPAETLQIDESKVLRGIEKEIKEVQKNIKTLQSKIPQGIKTTLETIDKEISSLFDLGGQQLPQKQLTAVASPVSKRQSQKEVNVVN